MLLFKLSNLWKVLVWKIFFACECEGGVLCSHLPGTAISSRMILSDVIMSVMASQVTGVSIVCSTVCSGADQRKHQNFASLARVRRIHGWPLDSPYKGPVTRKMCFIWWRYHALQRAHRRWPYRLDMENNFASEALYNVYFTCSVWNDHGRTRFDTRGQNWPR